MKMKDVHKKEEDNQLNCSKLATDSCISVQITTCGITSRTINSLMGAPSFARD